MWDNFNMCWHWPFYEAGTMVVSACFPSIEVIPPGGFSRLHSLTAKRSKCGRSQRSITKFCWPMGRARVGNDSKFGFSASRSKEFCGDDFRMRKMMQLLPSGSRLKATSQDREGGVSGRNWKEVVAIASSLYPLYILGGGFVAITKPSAFAWFVNRGPGSYALALGTIMLAMGITLEFRDLVNVFLRRPFAVLFGCLAQYSIMPGFGAIVSAALGLSPEFSLGLILLSCCPAGSASAVVTLIAGGDVPLSMVMTVCATLGAVFATPSLTKLLAGAYVPVDAGKLALSTLQVVVAPALIGTCLQSACPQVVNAISPFLPLLAVLLSSLLASSVFSANISLIKYSVVETSGNITTSILSGKLGLIICSVTLLHMAGFLVGYLAAAIAGFGESQCRAISIEVGMRNSSLGVVLASSHFDSPLIAVPAAVSAVIMNIVGSSLAFIWKHIDLPHEHIDGSSREEIEEKSDL